MNVLIVNADDFGMSESCTKAIIEAFNKKMITSTTICVNGDYFTDAIDLAFKNNIDNKVGIHLNLTSGAPLTEQIKRDKFFCNDEGLFHGTINRKLPLTSYQKGYVYEELTAQIQKLRNTGIAITHSDSHHHIHTALNIHRIFINVLKSSNIKKIRISRNIGNIGFLKRNLKFIYNRKLSRDFVTTELFGCIEDAYYAKPNGRSLEIMVHPDYDKDGVLIDRKGYDKGAGKPMGNILCIPVELLENYNFISYFELGKMK